MAKHVYDFAEAAGTWWTCSEARSNLAEMTNLGLPVPRASPSRPKPARFPFRRRAPAGLNDEIGEHLVKLEQTMGRKLGDPKTRCSFRCAAVPSSPCRMMDTVLDIGSTTSPSMASPSSPATSASPGLLPR